MIRKIFVFTFLAVAVVAAAMFPARKSDAAFVPQRGAINSQKGQLRVLPDFDTRLTNRGEFTDMDELQRWKQERCKALLLVLAFRCREFRSTCC
jgi:hypothetical protein